MSPAVAVSLVPHRSGSGPESAGDARVFDAHSRFRDLARALGNRSAGLRCVSAPWSDTNSHEIAVACGDIVAWSRPARCADRSIGSPNHEEVGDRRQWRISAAGAARKPSDPTPHPMESPEAAITHVPNRAVATGER